MTYFILYSLKSVRCLLINQHHYVEERMSIHGSMCLLLCFGMMIRIEEEVKNFYSKI